MAKAWKGWGDGEGTEGRKPLRGQEEQNNVGMHGKHDWGFAWSALLPFLTAGIVKRLLYV